MRVSSARELPVLIPAWLSGTQAREEIPKVRSEKERERERQRKREKEREGERGTKRERERQREREREGELASWLAS